VFLENVASITRCGMKEVIDELVIKRQWNCQWLQATACAVGAPHVRRRWFCLAVRPDVVDADIANDFGLDQGMSLEELVEAPETRLWDAGEPVPRVSLKSDADYDRRWINRAQALGNSVVPAVVRLAFRTLLDGCLRWRAISAGLGEMFVSPVASLGYPFPDAGLVIGGRFYQLPRPIMLQDPRPPADPSKRVVISVAQPVAVTTTSTTVVEEVEGGDEQAVEVEEVAAATVEYVVQQHYPTPRRGITHASSVTQRSIRDLPTVLVNSSEAREQLREMTGSDEIDRANVLANPRYLEWVMGYAPDWTRLSEDAGVGYDESVTAAMCGRSGGGGGGGSGTHGARGDDEVAPPPGPAQWAADDEEGADVPSGSRRRTRRRAADGEPSGPNHVYNGLNCFQRVKTGARDFVSVANAWRELSDAERAEFSRVAASLEPGSLRTLSAEDVRGMLRLPATE
jgi:hypothetical protein